ncbi:MAG: peptidoglycan DD-metalloendopeptidase family protein [Candidatus Pacebacteria bacterium]|nr:peptidoglycan DD-metalloendopeptidase family protein [Candidatus Paceibacterota bacterium]
MNFAQIPKSAQWSAAIVAALFLYVPIYGFAQSQSTEPAADEWQVADETKIDTWRRYDGAMRDALASLSQQPTPTFPIPVLFGVAVSDLSPNFGDARGNGTRIHEGLDIMAPRGTPIASPTDAIVLRTGNGPSSGLVVYTANPGGETFVYMHLDKIADGVTQGKRIPRGHIIGFVGDTGNAKGAGAHLHFEVRKNGATDPLPRLAETFSAAEQSASIAHLVASVSDPTNLAQYLVTALPNTLRSLAQGGVALPRVLSDALPSGAASASSVPIQTTPIAIGTVPVGDDLELGAMGAAVVSLQRMLIAKNTGPAAAYLARSGATGYFGTVTKNALVEFQKTHGITPASGYYGERTRAALTGAAAIPQAEVPVSPQLATASSFQFSRDLEVGMEGEDVRALQKILNGAGFTIAETGDGAPGSESTYFGARTRAALIAFQKAKGITPAAGYFGSKSRGILSPAVGE